MNYKEALHAVIDGKKIRHITFEKYMYLYMDRIGVIRFDDNVILGSFSTYYYLQDGWEIYQELFSEEYVKGWNEAITSVLSDMETIQTSHFPFGLTSLIRHKLKGPTDDSMD